MATSEGRTESMVTAALFALYNHGVIVFGHRVLLKNSPNPGGGVRLSNSAKSLPSGAPVARRWRIPEDATDDADDGVAFQSRVNRQAATDPMSHTPSGQDVTLRGRHPHKFDGRPQNVGIAGSEGSPGLTVGLTIYLLASSYSTHSNIAQPHRILTLLPFERHCL